MIGSEEQNVPTCFTTLPAYARRLGSLNESALPIVPRNDAFRARVKVQVPHSFFNAAPSTQIRWRMVASLRATLPMLGDLQAPGAQARPRLGANQKRMRRLIKSRARQFVAASADPPLYIRFAGLITWWGQTRGSADIPRFAEPLRSVDRRWQSESRQGLTPGALIKRRRMGSSRTMSRTCLVNLANAPSITPRISSRGSSWAPRRLRPRSFVWRRQRSPFAPALRASGRFRARWPTVLKGVSVQARDGANEAAFLAVAEASLAAWSTPMYAMPNAD